MKALHLSLSYKSAPALGGPDLTVYKLCTALGRAGVNVDVISTNLASRTTVLQPESFERMVDGIHVNYLAARKLIPLGRNSFGLYCVPSLRPLLRSRISEYDIVHLHGYRDYISVVGSREARKHGIPYVVHPRGTIPYQGHSIIPKACFDSTVGRRMIQCAAGLVALSEREVESFRRLRAEPARIEVVRNGLESRDYDPHARGDQFRQRHGIGERFVVLYFGRIHVIKGIDYMIRAVAHLRRQGVDTAAVVVGPDEGYGAKLARLARKEGLQGHLYLIPTVGEVDAKREVFAAADVLVYAAAVEDFGVSAFEGILSGVPTVVAAGTGCGEIVQQLDAGTLVSYGDVNELCRVLHDILSHPAKARQRALSARPNIIHLLDWNAIARQVQRFYERVCT